MIAKVFIVEDAADRGFIIIVFDEVTVQFNNLINLLLAHYFEGSSCFRQSLKWLVAGRNFREQNRSQSGGHTWLFFPQGLVEGERLNMVIKENHLITDKEGKPLGITTTSAKGNERIQALALLDQLESVRCKNSKNMTICEADKGYDSAALRMEILRRGYLPIIGYRRNQKNHISTGELYAFFKVSKRRWVVERTFSWLKRKCRRLLMRWERLPEVWNAFAVLGLVFMWLQTLLG